MRAQRWWAWPLVPIYAAALTIKDGLRAMGFLKVRELRWPVVSVGSFSAGGAGKTPVVIALAKLLVAKGWEVDVLSRGYGREGAGVERVGEADQKQVPCVNDRKKSKDNDNSNGNSKSNDNSAAKRFGDEPVLIAKTANVPVWVGGDRFAAGELAEQEQQRTRRTQRTNAEDAEGLREGLRAGRSLHLLDDGFQHRQLKRNVDAVLVTAEDLDDVLLPAGNLREGLGALKRADVVIVRQAERLGIMPRVRTLVREGTAVWSVQRVLRFPKPLGVLSAGLRPIAFCAIARPEGFAAMLHDTGCGVIETIAFADHHAYTTADIERIIEVAKGLNGSGFVTTEKDDVKLSAEMRERLATLRPLVVVALEIEFLNPAEVLSDLEERLA
ncbi:MAG: tetraacyldisaccharide 4'-kinase [Acidobacteriota bacterium]|nr:tetraacyldisaccharide 4'-kinase [Acidobacteriota bacterium]